MEEEKKKKKKSSGSTFARRAWRMVRLTLIWARKGGALRRALMFNLRLASNHLKSLKGGHGDSDRIRYGEREFSFDDTPSFRFKLQSTSSLRLPRFLCIEPMTSFDDDDDAAAVNNNFDDKRPYDENVIELLRKEEGWDGESHSREEDERGGEEEQQEEIDLRAEEFIAKFYDEMKLQRQISWLQYNEMLCRGM